MMSKGKQSEIAVEIVINDDLTAIWFAEGRVHGGGSNVKITSRLKRELQIDCPSLKKK